MIYPCCYEFFKVGTFFLAHPVAFHVARLDDPSVVSITSPIIYFLNTKHQIVVHHPGSCKPWNDIPTNNDTTTNNELSNYSIELSVQMGVSTGPP